MKVIAKKRVILFLPILITVFIALFYAARYTIYKLVHKQLAAEIEKLHDRGTDISYDSLYLNSWDGVIRVHGLSIKQKNDSNSCFTPSVNAYVPIIELKGIEVLSLIFKRNLSISSIYLEKPKIQFKGNSRKNKNKEIKLKGVSVDKLWINHARFEIIDSASCDTLKKLNVNLNLSDVYINNLNDTHVSWGIGKMDADSIQIEFPQSFYLLTINSMNFNSRKKTFTVDSLKLIPLYDKHVFAVKTIHQTDRVVCEIPSIQAEEFSLETLTKTKLYAKKVSLSMNLEAFRDKRYPFKKKKQTILPIEFLHRLGLQLQVDTLHLLRSAINYQEISEKGTEPGHIFFNQLTATILNISNTSSHNTIMYARANFMDAGILQATFTFPPTPTKLYHVKGELHDFELSKINPMLKPIASAQITEGKLSEMKFHFHYNDDHSNGEVLLDYTGLKMSSIKRENKKERKFLSLLLNTLVRDDMDNNVSKAKKTGTILFYRDKKKSIFNYWWKSLLSGIKSVYNLDKIMDTSGKKD